VTEEFPRCKIRFDMTSYLHRKTIPKTRGVRFLQALALSVLLLGVASGTAGQDTEAKKPPQKKTATSSPKWIEDKVSVRTESPYLSTTDNLILAYTVTNKSGADITLDFSEQSDVSTKPHEHEPTRVFFKLKDPPSYVQVSPQEKRVYLTPKLLPADLPMLFHIVLIVSDSDKPSWFSSGSPEDRLRTAFQRELSNTESIAIFIPDQHLKITFVVPSGPKK